MIFLYLSIYEQIGQTYIPCSVLPDNPAITLHELYYQLATHTTASHAGLYNDACYGNVYRNSPEEFLRP